MIDYILNAAVGIPLVLKLSCRPSHRCYPIHLLFASRFSRCSRLSTSGAPSIAFLIPTYMFIGTLIAVIGIGAFRAIGAHGHPAPIVGPPHLAPATSMLSLWLLAKVFSSGCTAMTGVEAVSNGTAAFRDPTQRNAKRTFTTIIVLLMIFLSGIAFLCRAYNIGATDPVSAGYQSILSQLISAVMGRGWFYYIGSASILAVLALSANTSYADFPRLRRAIAMNDYLPHVFKIRFTRTESSLWLVSPLPS